MWSRSRCSGRPVLPSGMVACVLFSILAAGVSVASGWIDYSKAVVSNMYYEVESEKLAPVDGKPHPFALVWKDSQKVVFEPMKLDWVERIKSPDGEHTASVVFVGRDSVTRFAIAIDGKEVVESHGKLAHSGIGSWSPDSKKYVFGTYEEGSGTAGLWEVYDVSEEGPSFKVRKIAKGKDSGEFIKPLYTPDGMFVSYINDNWLRLVDLRSKKTRALFHGAKAGVTMMTAAWSPDGKRIALGSFFKSRGRWAGRIAVLEFEEP